MIDDDDDDDDDDSVVDAAAVIAAHVNTHAGTSRSDNQREEAGYECKFNENSGEWIIRRHFSVSFNCNTRLFHSLQTTGISIPHSGLTPFRRPSTTTTTKSTT